MCQVIWQWARLLPLFIHNSFVVFVLLNLKAITVYALLLVCFAKSLIYSIISVINVKELQCYIVCISWETKTCILQHNDYILIHYELTILDEELELDYELLTFI